MRGDGFGVFIENLTRISPPPVGENTRGGRERVIKAGGI